ncbi:hypothetical protein AB5J62_22045 [Amycolatopsis sp. cg5]|uniref:hypothetical protein n=1 Tax=Amycolatopsis sp. cg5 TaxID=3238802 RepID=UPI003525BBFF
MIVAGVFLSLSRATISAPTSVKASAKLAWLDRITTTKEVEFRLRHAEISLCDANLGDDLYLMGWAKDGLEEQQIVRDVTDADCGNDMIDALPRVMALRGTPLDKVILRDVDLRACRFAGARGLDKLTLDGRIEFPRAPYTGRLMIADEYFWRCRKSPGLGRPARGAGCSTS